MSVLVTGGAGFIGSHVVDSLIEAGYEVLVLDDLSGGFQENVNPAATFVKGSVTDAVLVDKLFSNRRIEHVYHIAAYAAEGLSHFIRNYNYTNNLLGSINLINAAIRHCCKCFVFTSSIAVYGSGQTPMNESMTPQPEDPYGISKYAIELDLMAAKRLFGLDYIIFRPHNVYGERQNIGDPYRNVIGIFMNQILQGQPCTVFGDGTQTRAFTHIADVAPVIARSAFCPEAYNQVFNIGADIPYSVNELANDVQIAMGKQTGIDYLPARDETSHAFSDHNKSKKVFGTTPNIALMDGLQRMADWVKKAGAREGKTFDKIEVIRELPPSWKKLNDRKHSGPLTFFIPPGIGDFSAMYAKLSLVDREIIVCPSMDNPQRIGPYLDILPKIKNGGYRAHGANASLVHTLSPGTDLNFLENGEYFFAINSWLEEGKKVADWIPGPTDYHYDFSISDELRDQVKLALFPVIGKPLVGIYSSAYGNARHWGFWGVQEWYQFIEMIRPMLPKDVVFVFIGADFDIDLTEQLYQLCAATGIEAISTVGQFHIGATIELIKLLNYFFAFPSGLGFLADVVRTPHLMWFPPHLDPMRYTFTDPETSGLQSMHSLFCDPETSKMIFETCGLRYFREGVYDGNYTK